MNFGMFTIKYTPARVFTVKLKSGCAPCDKYTSTVFLPVVKMAMSHYDLDNEMRLKENWKTSFNLSDKYN